MNADEPLRPGGRRSKPRDRDRGCIAADDGLRLEHWADGGKDAALHVLLLGRRLDDEVAVLEGVILLDRGDAFERGLAFLLGDALAAHLTRHVAVDRGNARLDPI